MPEIHLTIFGQPVPKARARVVRAKSGKSFSYTPQPTVAGEDNVRAAFLASKQQPIPRGLPLVLHATFYLERPPSAPKKRRYPIVTPDLDNFGKLVTDALQGLAFENDAHFVNIALRKRYVVYPEPARTEMRIRTVEHG